MNIEINLTSPGVHVLDRSNDLRAWIPIDTNTFSATGWQLFLMEPTTGTAKFYRVRKPEP